jgi:hypothetical protein
MSVLTRATRRNIPVTAVKTSILQKGLEVHSACGDEEIRSAAENQTPDIHSASHHITSGVTPEPTACITPHY